MSGHSVEFSLGTNNSALKTGLDQAKHQVESFKEQTHEIFMSLFAGIGVEQLISKFARVKQVAEMFDTTSESVQRVDQLAQQFGANIETVARAMAKIRSGNGDALGKLGIDAETFAHAGMDEQLVMIAEALEKIDDPQERVNKAFEALGPRMKEILPLLNQGSEKIREMMAGFSVASNETVDQLHTAEQNIISMKNTVTVFAADIFGVINKVMLSIGNGVGSALGIAGNGIGRVGQALQALMHGDLKGVGAAMKANLSDITGGLSTSMQSLKDIWSGKQDGHGEGHGGMHGEGVDAGDFSGGGKERLSLAERLKALQEEHDRKQLDAAIRLKQLALERAMLEIKLFALGDSDAEKKKTMEDQLVANKKETLALEDKVAKDREATNERVAKEKERAEKDAARTAEKAARENERAEEKRMKDSFAERERNLGTISGVKIAGSDQGQRLAGVNYDAVNEEAQKGVELQIEMRNYLKSIDEKKWSVELPDAS